MSRDTDIARIAAALEQLPPAPYGGYGYRAMSGENLAAALYDAGLRLLADTPSVEPGEWTPEELEPFAPKNETGLMLGVAIGALFQSGRNEAHLASCPVARDVIWIIGRRPTAPSVEPAGPDVERLAEALKEYDAGRLRVPFAPSHVLSPDQSPSRFHRAWAKTLLDYAALPTQASDSPEKP